MAGTSTSEIQEQIKEACENYTTMTSLLLDMGYESLLENVESSNLTDSMQAILKVISALEQLTDDKTRGSATYQAHSANLHDFLTRKTVRTPPPKQLHSRDLHKLHLDKVLGKIDDAKLKDFIKKYQTRKFLQQRTNYDE